MKELRLLGKLVKIDECPVLLDTQPDENWKNDWEVKLGDWELKDGWLIGTEKGNRGGILMSKKSFDCNIVFEFTAKTVLPATRDVNAIYSAHWDEKTDYLGNAYIVGLNGWYEGKSGIERSPEDGLHALTGAYTYTPGSEVRITTGVIDGHNFLYVDGQLITELVDPNYISGGHVGFSPYCTKLAIKDIQVREAIYSDFVQSYEPEF